MTNPEEQHPLQELADEHALYERLRVLTYTTLDRAVQYLYERGVVFHRATEAPPVWMLHPAEHLPEAEAGDEGRLAVLNTDRATELAAGIAGHLLAQETGIPSAPEYKKRLQARCLLFEDREVWLSLVDSELPGEPLDMERDLDIILTVTTQQAEHDRARDELFRFAHLQFTSLLEAGESLPSDADRLVLWHLTRHFCSWAAEPSLHAASPWAEEARTFLLNAGVPLTPAWQRIIEFQWATDDDQGDVI